MRLHELICCTSRCVQGEVVGQATPADEAAAASEAAETGEMDEDEAS
jgi:hypothetical protein